MLPVDANVERMIGLTVTALYAYDAQQEDELTIDEQEELVIVADGDDGWCTVKYVPLF